jgi:hypothetical protein
MSNPNNKGIVNHPTIVKAISANQLDLVELIEAAAKRSDFSDPTVSQEERKTAIKAFLYDFVSLIADESSQA